MNRVNVASVAQLCGTHALGNVLGCSGKIIQICSDTDTMKVSIQENTMQRKWHCISIV